MFTDAKKWLTNYLKDGKPHELKKLQEDARGYGLVRSDLKRARKEIGVATIQDIDIAQGKIIYCWKLKK